MKGREMRFVRKLVVMALTLYCVAANAQVRKCMQPDGKTVYTDRPCPTAAKEIINEKERAAHSAAQGLALPKLHWNQAIAAHWCIDRWTEEVSPAGRAAAYLEAKRMIADATPEQRAKAQRWSDQEIRDMASRANIETFKTDCLFLGFREPSEKTDAFNEVHAAALRVHLKAKYPEAWEGYKQASGR